eukprot:m.121624 g.121624  ORF g.121624 m.121624 type:complete len:120 (+) comp15645_c0_seq5:781-1140(+)
MANVMSIALTVLAACTQTVSHKWWFCRAATAFHRLSQYAECIQWCDRGLELAHDNTGLVELRQKAVRGQAAQAKEERKRAVMERKQQAHRAKLDKAVAVRVHIANGYAEGSYAGNVHFG